MKNFNYYIKEATSNLFTNRVVTLTTVLTVVVSLFIIGIFNIISFNMVYVSQSLGNDFEFHIYVKDSIPKSELPSVEAQIMGIENVRDATLHSKEQTLDDVKSRFGETSALSGLNDADNPFRDSFLVTLTDLKSADQTIEKIKTIPQIDSVADNIATSQKLDSISKKIKLYSVLAYIILALICLSIISNIINVSIFSRRKHINIMKYVGATDRFVKVPFIFEGIIIGFFGAVISSVMLTYLYSILFGNFSDMINGISLMGVFDISKSLFITNIIFGLAVGGAGASLAVNKYLKV